MSEPGSAAAAGFVALADPCGMNIAGPNGETHIGGSQEWYEKRWHRMSGCGPVAASNLIWHMTGTKGAIVQYRELMLAMFDCVTPGRYGVNTSAIFCDGIARYCAKHGLSFAPHALDVPAPHKKRPSTETARDFIAAALKGDSPVAFLNLSNGSLGNLEAWHWVTIIALDTGTMLAEASDYGNKLELDISAWLKTSVLGGAFVCLSPTAQ